MEHHPAICTESKMLRDEFNRALPFKIEYRFSQAYNEFVKTSDEIDTVTKERWGHAFELASCERFDRAIQEFERLAEDSPKLTFWAWFNSAVCCLLFGRIADAAVRFSKAENISPLDNWLHIYAGICDLALGLTCRANLHWWTANQITENDFSQRLLNRFFTDEHHPERMALYPLCKGRGIDVGCGHRKTHPDAIGVDLLADGGRLTTAGNVYDKISQADVACTGDALNIFEDKSLDYVVQRHNLEHYQDPIRALQEWIRILRHGGILGMVVPDDEVCDTLRLDQTHKHVFTQSSIHRIIDLLPEVRVVHLAPLLFRWSFVCVVQKVGDGLSEPFDYPACIINQEREEIWRRLDLYKQSGLHGLASQCIKYLNLQDSFQR